MADPDFTWPCRVALKGALQFFKWMLFWRWIKFARKRVGNGVVLSWEVSDLEFPMTANLSSANFTGNGHHSAFAREL